MLLAALLAASPLAALDGYISSSSGNDTNDGSISAPLKTLAAAPKKDANIFLKRGDVFYEKLRDLQNCNVDAYGDGAKPLICGLKILKNKNAWERLPNGIWRLDLKNAENFEGYRTANPKEDNIGCVYDIAQDRIYGHLVRRYSDLNAFGDFWVSDSVSRVDVRDKNETFRFLYFKFDKNPAESKSRWAFSAAANGASNLKNCRVRNIAIKGFGIQGICGAWNCEFSGLDIDLIGGSVQLSYRHWTRLGNGVEFWISDSNPCNNNVVEGCKISRTYDCGSTIQGVGKNAPKAANIVFRNNVFLHCRQAFEHFIHSPAKEHVYENCEFSGNKCFDMGKNFFSSPETRDANILSYDRSPISGLVIKDNLFWGAPYYSRNGYTAKLENNTVYIYRGQYLAFARARPEETVWADSDADIAKAEKILQNGSDKIIIVEPGDVHLREKVLREAFAEQKSEIIKNSPEKYRRDFFRRK